MDGAKEQLSELKRLALMAVGELGQELPKVDLIDKMVENQIKIDNDELIKLAQLDLDFIKVKYGIGYRLNRLQYIIDTIKKMEETN